MSVRTVILTRPEADSRAVSAALPDIPCVIAPLTRITHHKTIPHVLPPKAWLATSRHAITHADATLKNLPWFAVGKRTAEAGLKAGLKAPEIVADTAETLAAELTTHLPSRISPLLYLSAKHARFDFSHALQSAKIDVIRQIAYEAETVETLPENALAALASGTSVIIAHYSVRSAQIFYALAENAGLSCESTQALACCISAEVAAACPAKVTCQIAESPDGNGMIQLLQNAATL